MDNLLSGNSSLAFIALDNTGTPVQIHSARDPNPIWRDFEGRPLKAIATK